MDEARAAMDDRHVEDARIVDEARLIALVDANLDAFVRHFGGHAAGEIPGSIRWAAGIAGATAAAGVAGVGGAGGAAEAAGSGDPGFGTWTRAHADAALEAVLPLAGFRLVADLPVMILETRPEARRAPDGVRIRPVVDVAGVEDFLAADRAARATDVEEAFAIDPVRLDTATLLHPGVAAFVAYVEGEPVAAALSFTAPPVTRIAWVGTAPVHRRRGLGDAVARAALLAGFDRGATIAALESSAAALELYRSMGFRQVTSYRTWRIG